MKKAPPVKLKYPETPTGGVLQVAISDIRKKMARSEYGDVLEDLISFTGLSKEEVLFRIARKKRGQWGAKGWFWEE